MSEENMKEFEEELRELGIEIISEKDITEKYAMGIEFDLDTEVDYSKLVLEDFVMKKYTKRQDFFYIALKSYDTEKKRLTVYVGTPVSEEIFKYYGAATATLNRPIGTHFSDLCWYYSQGTSELNKEEVETKFREDAEYGDLTWNLPTRMVDNFIEIMHLLNQSFLQGLMQDTICYGPYLAADNSKK